MQGEVSSGNKSILRDAPAKLKWFSAVAGGHDADRDKRGPTRPFGVTANGDHGA